MHLQGSQFSSLEKEKEKEKRNNMSDGNFIEEELILIFSQNKTKNPPNKVNPSRRCLKMQVSQPFVFNLTTKVERTHKVIRRYEDKKWHKHYGHDRNTS